VVEEGEGCFIENFGGTSIVREMILGIVVKGWSALPPLNRSSEFQRGVRHWLQLACCTHLLLCVQVFHARVWKCGV